MVFFLLTNLQNYQINPRWIIIQRHIQLSPGGVFIATLFGLALAMVTLAGEVIYYRRRNAQQDDTQKMRSKSRESDNEQIMIQKLTAKLQLKPAPPVFLDGIKPLGPKPRVSHISVYPRPFPFKE